jgi:ABC-type transport system involved in cytochrome c biogenesis ATPase subunit
VFNPEQRAIFLQVQHAISAGEPLFMFIDGKAGRGKTFLVNILCAWVRSTGRIALPTATSVFAAQLYPGGQTTHSTFGV